VLLRDLVGAHAAVVERQRRGTVASLLVLQSRSTVRHDAPDGIRVLPEHLDFQLVNGGIYSNKAATRWTPQGNDVVVEQCYGFHFAGLAPEPVRGYLLQV